MMICLHCERCAPDVRLESSRTAYAAPVLNYWGHLLQGDDPSPDPNAAIPLCPPCAKEHHAYWDAMWADSYGGLL